MARCELTDRPRSYRDAPVALVSYYDVFPVGLGLDLAGAALLARGLFTRPRDVAKSIKESRNSLSRFNVRAAQDRADGVGALVLFAGFAMQGLGYVLYIGGVMSKTHGSGAGWIAVALLVVGFAVGFAARRVRRSQQIRRYLVELARLSTELHNL